MRRGQKLNKFNIVTYFVVQLLLKLLKSILKKYVARLKIK